MMILAGFLMFFIESSKILLPGASPKLSGSLDAAVLGDTGLTLAWGFSWSPALGPLLGFCCSAPLELVRVWEERSCRWEERKGGILQEELGKLELPLAWCHIARVRTCIKSGWAQSCRDLALLCLFPEYVEEKESAIHWELYVLRMFRNLLAQLTGPGGKKKFIIFQLCFKIPDSSEVSFHRILIILCQS